MKTIWTMTFTIAVMVFAFNANLAMAQGEKQKYCRIFTYDENQQRVCKEWIWVENNKMDELHDPDRSDNKRDVADSGNEGSTSAASANDQ